MFILNTPTKNPSETRDYMKKEEDKTNAKN